MKKLALIFVLIISSISVSANDFCSDKVSFDYDVIDSQGTVMRMTIKDEEAYDLFVRILPYSDCNSGVCTSFINSKDKEIVINFKSERYSGHYASGVYASYTTFTTDNGVRLDITTPQRSASFLFNGCYE